MHFYVIVGSPPPAKDLPRVSGVNISEIIMLDYKSDMGFEDT